MKLQLSTLSHKNLPTLLIALLFVALYVFGVWYVKHLHGIVNAQATELAAETTREASLHNLGGFLQSLSADQSRLASLFITPAAAVGLIERIEQLGDDVGAIVSISGVTIDDKNAETGEGTMVMNVAAEGSWRKMTQLLALLDTLPFASRVERASFIRSGDTESGGAVWSLRAVVHVPLRRSS